MSKQPQQISDFRRPISTPASKQSKLASVAWLGMLFVVLSIGFSSYMVYFGSSNPVAKLMLIPQVIFAAAVLIHRFSK